MMYVFLGFNRYNRSCVVVSSVNPENADSDDIDSNSFEIPIPHNYLPEAMRNIVFNVLQAGSPGNVIHFVE